MMSKMSKSQTKDFFNTTSGDYFFDREEEYAFEAQKRIIFRMIQKIDGHQKKVVDIGCGSGLLTHELLQRGYEVWGIDFSDEMISNANVILKEKNISSEKVHYSTGDIENLDFSDNYFDVIISIGVLEYLPTYDIALNEIYRVLKPSGAAVITLPSRISPFYIPFRFAEKTFFPLYRTLRKMLTKQPPPYCPQVNPCVPWDFDKQLEKSGLTKVESKFCNFIFYPLHPLFPNFSVYISKKLEALSKSRFFGYLGTQYIVKAEKK